jgi:hypothetical protein
MTPTRLYVSRTPHKWNTGLLRRLTHNRSKCQALTQPALADGLPEAAAMVPSAHKTPMDIGDAPASPTLISRQSPAFQNAQLAVAPCLRYDCVAYYQAVRALHATLRQAAKRGREHDSLSDNGRIAMLTIRPAPEWMRTPGVTPAEPASKKRPPVPSSSTARRTRSQTLGSSCHSSTSTGGGNLRDEVEVAREGYVRVRVVERQDRNI